MTSNLPQSDPKTFKIPSGFEDFVSNSEDLLKEFQSYQDIENEDEVSYSIYFDEFFETNLNPSSSEKQISHSLKTLISFKEIIMRLIERETSHYIWFLEHFQLLPVIKLDSAKNRLIPSLRGCTSVGENIEDEWFIVYLLMKISDSFPNASIQVRDNDGEFLLIEAADHVDDWLTPDTSKNRVWIRNGKIHIIPNHLLVSRVKAEVDLWAALNCLINPADLPSSSSASDTPTIANHHVQNAIAQRTTNIYPQRIFALDHYSLCILPCWIAHLLTNMPQLLPIAIHYFTQTESAKLSSMVSKVDIGSLTSTTSSSDESNEDKLSPDSLQLYSIRFSRILYAKATFKQIKIPKKYHHYMRRIQRSNSSKVMKAFDLGCRIMAGVDIALYHEQQVSHSQIQNTLLQQVSENNKTLLSFLHSSNTANKEAVDKVLLLSKEQREGVIVDEYFKELQQFTHTETQILPRVKKILERGVPVDVTSPYTSITEDADPVKLFQPLLKALGGNGENESLRVDKEEWLYLTPEEFDKEMLQRMNLSSTGQSLKKEDHKKVNERKDERETKKSDVENIQEIFEEFKSFLNQKSDYEGITPSRKTSIKAENKKSENSDKQEIKEKKVNIVEPITEIEDVDMGAIESLLAEATLIEKQSEQKETGERESNEAIAGVAQKYLSIDSGIDNEAIERDVDSDDEDDEDLNNSDAEDSDDAEELEIEEDDEAFGEGDYSISDYQVSVPCDLNFLTTSNLLLFNRPQWMQNFHKCLPFKQVRVK